MFGIKWLWKTNRGSNIDTSNFVSKEFLNTTLQDYVNRDLLNTTLSNELANYVSTSALNTKLGEYINRTEFNINIIQYVRKTQLNTTLADYVQTNTLNTTLSNYVQTNTLNTTLSNYVQTSALSNYVSTNTAQTITGAKTFTEGIVINKTPVPLTLKATDNNKTYIVYKDSSNNSNFSLGSNSGQTSLEVNRGDLLIQTQQNNKTVSIETGRVKLNRSILECGTEINAGYGGGAVKFIPEDNSTKTLQFYNSAATDNRRFNLLVPEPTAAQNPATKNYVDNAIAGVSNANLVSQINELNTFKTSVENSYGYNIRYQDIQLQNNSWLGTETIGNFVNYITSIDTFRDVKFLSATIHFGNDYNFSINKYIMFSAAGRGDSNRVYLNILRLTNVSSSSPNFDNAYVRVFYIDNISARTEDPYFIVEEDN